MSIEIESIPIWVWIVIICIITIIIAIALIKGLTIKIFGLKIKKEEKKMDEKKLFINAKNVNTGTNYGNIGDVYTGIQQRHFSEQELNHIILEIEDFKKKCFNSIEDDNIYIGYPGDKESYILANEIRCFIQQKGYNATLATLMTYGVYGRKYGISNSPSNGVLVEIYPNDNV